MMNKKAVSAVVATVLIILITIAAVTIIWSAIIPLIQNNIAGSGDCLAVSGQISINAGSSCINISTNRSAYNSTIRFGVHRGSGNFELTALSAKAIASDGNSYPATIANVSQLLPNGDRTFTLNSTNFNMSLDDFDKTIKINVAPKVKTGAQSKECDPVREVLISACA